MICYNCGENAPMVCWVSVAKRNADTKLFLTRCLKPMRHWPSYLWRERLVVSCTLGATVYGSWERGGLLTDIGATMRHPS